MRRRWMLWMLLAVSSAVSAQESKTHFLIRIEPVRATFNQDATAEEQKVMGEHFQYLKGLIKDGKLILAGPAETGARPFGIIVVEVPTIEEARSIMAGDPSVKAGVMRGEVFPFTLALLRGRD